MEKEFKYDLSGEVKNEKSKKSFPGFCLPSLIAHIWAGCVHLIWNEA
jgi:hypothetical protein